MANYNRKVSSILEGASQKVWTAAKDQKKKKKKKKDDGSEKHAASTSKLKAILWKFSVYAQRGHDYLEGDAGRHKEYQDFPHAREVFDEYSYSLLERHAKFPGGMTCNFNPKAKAGNTKAGQSYPYKWEAHHMIPASAFYTEDENGKLVFTWEQYRLLLQTEYDLNHGHNIIMLPKESWAVPIHSMIQHPSDHKEYTKKVMNMLKRMAKRIQEKVDEQEDHENITADFLEDLKSLEDRLWRLLVNLGKKTVEKALSGETLDAPVVKYEAASTGTKYKWGSLA